MVSGKIRGLSVLTLFFVPLLMTACGDVSGPSHVNSVNGWVVGSAADGYGMILHSVDGGSTWIRQGDISTIPHSSLCAVRAVDSLNAWVVGNISNGYGVVLKTQDAGATWERLSQSSGIPSTGFLDLDVLSANNIWVVGGNNTIIHSVDGGNSWTSKSDPAYDLYSMTSITVVDASNIWVAGATASDAVIIHSIDGGATWTAEGDSALLTDYPLISISAFDTDHCWTVGHGSTIANTIDSGVNWNLCTPDSLFRSPFSPDANGVCPTTVNRAWVAMDFGMIYLTEDGGNSWTKQSVSGAAGGYYLLRTCATDQNTAWTVGQGGDGGIILHTSDGTIWSVQTAPTNEGFGDVSFVNSFH
ncbi:MAG: hypothetical protein KAR44_02835 [Candidatus Aegiribacteria sp.]|nr:hypothetical protein [Candidatus Aegiribacteria sp.]